MFKNDKIVVIIGVIILVLSSVGVFYWVEEAPAKKIIDSDDFIKADIHGVIHNQPAAISTSDDDPFYTIVSTPLAVHFDKDGNKFQRPLYVQNQSEVSSAVTRVKDQLGYEVELEIPMDFDFIDTKRISLELAKNYWQESKAAILVHNETGYNLSVIAAPVASYLGIPIIVTDEVDEEVNEVLEELDVEYTIVCGELEGFGKQVKYVDSDIEDLVDFVVEIIRNNLGHDVEYVSITNPRDAKVPEVLNSEIILYEEGSLSSGNIFPSHLVDALQSRANQKTITFNIPDKYKYALVKLELKNLEDPEFIEKFGDNLIVSGSLTGYIRTVASPVKKDESGNIEYDHLLYETVLYDMGGEELNVKLSSSYHTLDSGKFEITITAYELENPYYPFMKAFSSIAPYHTACREGLVYGKPDFAFVADDDIEYNGETLPGNTQVFFNPMLIPVINQHVYENIHNPLNDLFARIKDIDISESTEMLTKSCSETPFNICIFGDTTMVPHYYYRSPHSDPFTKPKTGSYGTNCPSDFIYGNIDPQIYSLRPYSDEDLENDLYSEFPEMENNVGRIVGWDVQDASALIARTLFYDEIIDDMGDWKDNALVQTGAGTEVQKLPFFTFIQSMLGQTDPMKFPSGEKQFMVQRIEKYMNELGGFKVTTTERGQSQRVGYSNEALWEIKTDGLLNLLLFPMLSVKIRQGYENIHSLFDLKWWAEALFSDGSGINGGELQQNSNMILCDQHAIWFEIEHGDIMMYSLGGPKVFYELLSRYIPIVGRFASPLDQLGAYSVRDVSEMEMGPSVMMIEGCGSGKIDGMPPTNSLANAYLHSGVNAYISPSTLSAFYGALEPRFGNGVGFGIIGYIKAALDGRKGVYPPVYFNQFIFEEACKLMYADEEVTIGEAMTAARNKFLYEQFDIPFRWTPPLSVSPSMPEDLQQEIYDDWVESASRGMDTFPVEKYCTIFQINLLGDPAFNPYEPVNE